MRDNLTLARREPFHFWSKGEVVRLGVIAAMCAIPLSLPEPAPQVFQNPQARAQQMTSPPNAGRVRGIRVTDFDLGKIRPAALGDIDSAD